MLKSSPNGVRGKAPATKSFGAFWVLRVSLLQYAKLRAVLKVEKKCLRPNFAPLFAPFPSSDSLLPDQYFPVRMGQPPSLPLPCPPFPFFSPFPS